VVFEEGLAARRASPTKRSRSPVRPTTRPRSRTSHVTVCVALASEHARRSLRHGEELAGSSKSWATRTSRSSRTGTATRALVEAGRLAEADEALVCRRRLAGQLGPAMPVWVSTFTRSARALLAGDTDTAEALAAEQLELGEARRSAGRRALLRRHPVPSGWSRVGWRRSPTSSRPRGAARRGRRLDGLWGITACALGPRRRRALVLDKLAVDDFTRVNEHQAWTSIHWAAPSSRATSAIAIAPRRSTPGSCRTRTTSCSRARRVRLGRRHARALAAALDLPDDAARHFDRA
jgi:hypothetical protein